MAKANPLGTQNKFPAYHLIPGSLWGELKTVKKSPSGKKAGDVWMENDEIKQIRKMNGIFINDIFIPLWKTDAQILLLEGSYGSSKTTYALTRLLVACMENEVFKCFYGRQDKTMAAQLHSNIIREIKRNGWENRFDYSEKPNGTKKIYCISNGNMFELFGCNDDDTLKGIDNPTHILVDEVNQISFESFGMLISRLRTSGAPLQFIGCFNPCDVMENHWIVKYMYNKGKGETESEEAVLEALEDLQMVSHHSTYLNNYFQNPDYYYRTLVLKAGGDSERVKDYALGRWGAKLNSSPYYKQFKYERDVYEYLGYDSKIQWDGVSLDENGNKVGDDGRTLLEYFPQDRILYGFDENVQPYLPSLIAQRHGDEIWFLDEIWGENPNNHLFYICPKFDDDYNDHKGGVDIFGDATSRKQDAKTEEGQDFFTIAAGLLKRFSPNLRIRDANPNNKTRGLFINVLFKLQYMGVKIKISKRCKHLIEDMQNCMEAMDANGARTGKKDKSTSMVKGVRQVQQYGHFGDILDYIMCEEFSEQYILFQNDGQSHDPTGGRRRVENSGRSERDRAMDLRNPNKTEYQNSVVRDNNLRSNFVEYEQEDYENFSYGRRQSNNRKR